MTRSAEEIRKVLRDGRRMVHEAVEKLLREELSLEGEIKGESQLDDLYMDSLDVANLAIALEYRFEIVLYYDVLDRGGSNITIDQIVDLVVKKMLAT